MSDMVTTQDTRARWSRWISDTYFPLSLSYRDENAPFRGDLKVWKTDDQDFSLSRLTSDGLVYSRDQAQIAADPESSFLVTIPQRAEVFFEQGGRSLRCEPGQFLVERGGSSLSLRLRAGQCHVGVQGAGCIDEASGARCRALRSALLRGEHWHGASLRRVSGDLCQSLR